MTSEDVEAVVDEWGIQTRWINAHDEPVSVPEEVLASLRSIIGNPPDDLDERAPIVTRPGRRLELGAGVVTCEDGSVREVDGTLSEDFPLGYHAIVPAGRGPAEARRLIVSPGKCWLPDGFRAWGFTVQLYSSLSRNSWGIGDLADLRSITRLSRDLGAGFVLVNPLFAVAPVVPVEASPYLPVTRRFRNPIYLAIDDVPGATGVDLDDLREQGRALNQRHVIDRDATWELKHAALRRIYDARDGDETEFELWRTRMGAALQDFSVWCVLAMTYGGDFRAWDDALRDPRSDDVAAFTQARAREVTFHAWMQWLLDRQLTEAAAGIALIQDLPIGVHGGGADAWAWTGQVAEGVAVGAPPDLYVPSGQNWGSPPLVPWRLRADGYQPFIESIRATIGGAGGIRIDHVMGLFRLWWIAPGNEPADGAYVRYPSADLLDIVALESHRANALVVGEDLGTVEDGVREALADHTMLSYRLVLFEEGDPEDFPVLAMAAVTTHDLPTMAGLWSGRDADEQLMYTKTAATTIVAARQTLRANALGEDASGELTDDEAVMTVHRKLARVPSALVSASLEDAVCAQRRPNMPGSTDRDNWSIPLPVRIDELGDMTSLRALAKLLTASVDSH